MPENLNLFDFELSVQGLGQIATLDTKESLFFDHRDPEKVKLLSERKSDI